MWRQIKIHLGQMIWQPLWFANTVSIERSNFPEKVERKEKAEKTDLVLQIALLAEEELICGNVVNLLAGCQ